MAVQISGISSYVPGGVGPVNIPELQFARLATDMVLGIDGSGVLGHAVAYSGNAFNLKIYVPGGSGLALNEAVTGQNFSGAVGTTFVMGE